VGAPVICHACAHCDGRACSGQVPGMGGAGSGAAFTANIEALARIGLLCASTPLERCPDTAIELLGRRLAMPVLAAPVAGVALNMGATLLESEYIGRVLGGCIEAGTLAMTGDGVHDDLFQSNMRELRRIGAGSGIAIVKPWDEDLVRAKFAEAEAAGAVAVGVDIDAARMPSILITGKPIRDLDRDSLARIVATTRLPFIVKGVLTVEAALIARDAGAAAIVVSNHGGRISDDDPGTATVLRRIVQEVGGDVAVLADGGVRSGADVLKMLALGARSVLIGRPVATAALRGGAEGVRTYLERIHRELRHALSLTGCAALSEVDESLLTT
jgi:4-hydroxymandelate oxidase